MKAATKSSATKNAKSAEKSTTETWMVICTNHDYGAQDVSFIRKSKEDAERSARLFRQCGYQVEVKQFTK